MTIPINQLLCGNCSLFTNGRCSVDSSRRSPTDSYCIHIFDNFMDSGYKKPEIPPIHIDFEGIDKECREFNELMEKFRLEHEGGVNEEEIKQSYFPF